MYNWKIVLPALLLIAFGVVQGKVEFTMELTLYAAFYLAGIYKKEYALYLFALSFPFMTYRPLMFFLLVLIFLLLLDGVDKQRLKQVLTSKVFFASAFFILAVGITAVTSVNLRESLGEYVLYYIPSLILLVVMMLMIGSKQVLYRFLLCFVISGALISVYGLAQYFLLDSMPGKWVDRETNPLLDKRVYATFGNPNIFSQFLLLVMPLAFVLIYYVRDFKQKCLVAVLFGLTALALLLTFSRGAWLAAAIAFVLILLKIDRKLILTGMLLLVVAVLFDLIPDVIKQRIASIADPFEDTSGQWRLQAWLSALAIIRDYWVTGIGMDTTTFNRVYVDYQMPQVNVFHFHNIWIQSFVTGGILGIGSLLFLFYQLVKTSFAVAANRLQKRLSIWGIGLFASLIGLAAAGMTEDVFHDYRVMMAFWLIAAAIGAIEIILRQERRENETA
ncbi:O-antigen ligase family protein [Brevibacillus humidisoli]|uniref:O-antigen ligase family protein n=1 Tax=Brevibacillus humidisoli TaxID=2895522 RepID=UPI001E555644|nr:O-antigen ligase family protein [Brevibacillus humidisoli]UFJ39149.1 O-antigen ligase family protein [Brevibacillus humidisoli]